MIGRFKGNSFTAGLSDNSLSKRVLRVLLDASSKPQEGLFGNTGWNDIRDFRLSFCQGTGLIKYNGRNFFGNFKGVAIFNQDTQLSTTAKTNRNGCGCCETQRTGARDYKHGYESLSWQREAGQGGPGIQ